MSQLNRRLFVSSALSAAGVAAIGRRAPARVRGANDAVRIAVCGLNGRGGDHIKEFAKIPGVRVTHLVDPDTRVYAKRQKQLRDLQLPEAVCVQDVRKVLESKDVDAIAIATPNHWHALMTIWACQAGKDVYVEKPCSHNVHEGRIAVQAAKKHNRIVQHGTQRRASKNYQQLAAIVRRGDYGPLRVSRGIVYKLRPSIGVKPVTETPAEVDFDLWTGPAPKTPFHANLVHYNWHWFWDFGNGDIGNQGVHQMDVARWMIPGATWPKSAFSLGGRFGYRDQGETPNTQLALFDYGETLLLFEVRGLPTRGFPGDTDGSVLHFDGGHVTGNKFYPKGKTEGEPLPKIDPPEAKLPHSTNIFANFIACVRSRKAAELVAGLEDGHYSSGLCHLANVSYRVGSETAFQSRPKLPIDNKEANETLAKMEEHLANSVGFKPAEARLRVGKALQFDAGSEQVLNSPEANALLQRVGRAPFVVPRTI